MTRKGQATRRTQIPIDYIAADPEGGRAARRLAAREAKAAKRGRAIGHSSGGEPIKPPAGGSDAPKQQP